MYLNKAFVYGNMTRDPELNTLPSGSKVANFSIATNRVWKNQAGEKQESVDFHNIVVFGRQAEIVTQYLRKGSGLLVEGRIQTRSWDGQDGKKNYRTEIVADSIQFGPKSGGAGAPAAQQAPAAQAAPAAAPVDVIEYPQEDINPEDIPF